MRQGRGQLLYGVSCHRRVGAADLLHRDASVSRSSVQKAVCVLLRCPFFGVVQQRLSPVTQVFFEQRDFRCTTLLSDFFAQLDAVEFEKLPESELFHALTWPSCHTSYPFFLFLEKDTKKR